MTAAANTAQQVPIPLSAPTVHETSRTTAAASLPEPRLVLHHVAQLSPDPAARFAAQALATVVALVPCRLAIFWSVTRRKDVGDAVVLEDASQNPGTRIDAGFYRARARSVDPFAPSRAARTGASLLTVEDAGGALRLANSAYGRHLQTAGLEHQVSLYLRDAGAVRAMIALFRVPGAPGFDRGEIRMLRQLHPLLEHACALSLRLHVAAEPAPTLPALTRREAEVAALIASGATNAEIATALNIEQATVKTHLNQVYAKFGLRSRTQLALRLNAERLGLGERS